MSGKSITAVRVLDLPFDIACMGIVVWNGPQPVDVLGHRVVDVVGGASGDGQGISVLTVVQPRSQPVLDGLNVQRVRAWAESWFQQTPARAERS
jgi:hypothetical protein